MEAVVAWSPVPWAGAGASGKADKPAGPSPMPVDEGAILVRTAPENVDLKNQTDEQLMRAVAACHAPALEALYDRHSRGCFGLALKIVRDPSVAEEVVQDVFVKLWSKPTSFSPERGKFSGWLLTMVHNRSVDKLRRARTGALANTVPLDLDNGTGTSLADVLPDTGPTPYDEVWRNDKGDVVRSALEQLPQTQRQAIAMAYFDGLTQKEIAEKLHEPLGTIKTRTRSGLLHLRRVLALQGGMLELR